MTWLWFPVAAIIVAILAFGLLRAYYFRTVYIVVHPWYIGTTKEEMNRALDKLERDTGSVFLPGARESLIAEHERYFRRLAKALRFCLARHVILLDSDERTGFSYPEVRRLVPWFIQVVHIETTTGRATLLEGSWKELAAILKALRIAHIRVFGAYLGLSEGQLVQPTDDAHYFCVNEAVLRLREAQEFQSVEPVPHFSFTRELSARELEKPAAGHKPERPRRPSKSKRRRRKK